MSKEAQDSNEFARGLQLNGGTILGMVTKAAIQLDLFEIIAKASTVNGTSPFGDDARKMSSDDIVALLPTKNPAAPAMLDRILRFLAAKSILNWTTVAGEDGKEKSLYSLTSICKYYTCDEDGISLAPMLVLLQDKVILDSWTTLKDAVLEGGVPFNMAHDGMHAFEYPAIDSRFNDVFNQGMYNQTTLIMKKILEVYTGFEEIIEIVDVGGGTGATLAKIIAKYPRIRGINFDLAHVIKGASPLPGVEHVGGDMFVSVPKGEVIFMKWILHDWSDEHCLKVLKNCCNSLPEFGKVIIIESIMPEYSDTDSLVKLNNACDVDMVMLALNPGGKERSLKEFEELAKESGFAAVKLMCSAGFYSVLEFYKKAV
ncbi:caffeic acid 3-O-methyltransferase-like [Apium graveolens]|uniref:caffeic acid 3-O-methyltransferase-like n=1 Tax=Apium graveolens TaxID=4045 RepID=UPI003D7A66B8